MSKTLYFSPRTIPSSGVNRFPLIKKRNSEDLHRGLSQVNFEPLAKVFQRHIVIEYIGDIITFLHNRGHFCNVTLAASGKVTGVVIDTHTNSAQPQ